MGKIADATFNGASGTEYGFGVYTLDTSFKNIGAVYIFSKRTVSENKGTHYLLYIGQTEELADRISNHEKWPCLNANNVNCICVHVDETENSRLRKETDLLRANETPRNR